MWSGNQKKFGKLFFQGKRNELQYWSFNKIEELSSAWMYFPGLSRWHSSRENPKWSWRSTVLRSEESRPSNGSFGWICVFVSALKPNTTRSMPIVEQVGVFALCCLRDAHCGETWGVSLSGCQEGVIINFQCVFPDLGAFPQDCMPLWVEVSLWSGSLIHVSKKVPGIKWGCGCNCESGETGMPARLVMFAVWTTLVVLCSNTITEESCFLFGFFTGTEWPGWLLVF